MTDIYEFTALEDAEDFQEAFHDKNCQTMQAGGYTVINNEIIGKNMATGQDAPDAQHTTAYYDISEDTGKFYVDDPEADFPDWQNDDDLKKVKDKGIKKEKPIEENMAAQTLVKSKK